MNGWILVSSATESGNPTHYWDGDEWVDFSANAALLNNAQVSSVASGVGIAAMRAAKGDFQQRFTDRDVRIAEVTTTITLGSVIS